MQTHRHVQFQQYLLGPEVAALKKQVEDAQPWYNYYLLLDREKYMKPCTSFRYRIVLQQAGRKREDCPNLGSFANRHEAEQLLEILQEARRVAGNKRIIISHHGTNTQHDGNAIATCPECKPRQ